MRSVGAKRKQKPLHRRKYTKAVPTSSPPRNEAILPLPIASGAFLETLELLKDHAFNAVMQNEPDVYALPVKKTTASSKYYINGFSAFMSFYAGEFYRLPVDISAKYFSAAWEACPHKHIWESYAKQYKRYFRDIPFVEWLLTCKKLKDDSNMPFVMIREYGPPT